MAEELCRTHPKWKPMSWSVDSRLPTSYHLTMAPGHSTEKGHWMVFRPGSLPFDPNIVVKTVETPRPNPLERGLAKPGFRSDIWIDRNSGEIRHYHVTVDPLITRRSHKVFELYTNKLAAISPALVGTDQMIATFMASFPKFVVTDTRAELTLPRQDEIVMRIDETGIVPQFQESPTEELMETDAVPYPYNVRSSKGFSLTAALARIAIPENPRYKHDRPFGEDVPISVLVPDITPDDPITYYDVCVGVHLPSATLAEIDSQVRFLLQTGPIDNQNIRALIDPFIDLRKVE